MIRDAQRYLPCLDRAEPRKTLFDVKTVLTKNERDDGRPILYQQMPADSRVVSILGGKIDNIYDLFSMLPQMESAFAGATTERLFGKTGA